MKGRKEVLWAVVISAALITAGLILNCGDDDGGVSCKDFCEKLKECDWIGEEGYFGETVEECIEGCEKYLDPAEEGVKDLFECIVDTDCGDIVVDCWCQIPCEKIDDCDLLDDYEFKDVEDCVGDCIIWGPDVVFCVLHNACDDIIAECVD